MVAPASITPENLSFNSLEAKIDTKITETENATRTKIVSLQYLR